MSEYIDRDMAEQALNKEAALILRKMPYITIADSVDRMIKIVQEVPTADVAPVVRCKDCRWRGSEECAMFYRCECGEQHTWEMDDDFCSYGERIDT